MLAQKRLALEATLQRPPTSKELAEALGISEADLLQMQRLSQPARCVSLDEENSSSADEESLPLKEIIPDPAATIPSDALDAAEIRQVLHMLISKLPPSDASVIILRYMRNMPFNEIAQHMHLTPSRISQLHHHALETLKSALKKKGDSSILAHRPMHSPARPAPGPIHQA
jgi:RNA polymerase sigma factor for flagellar operon FliA